MTTVAYRQSPSPPLPSSPGSLSSTSTRTSSSDRVLPASPPNPHYAFPSAPSPSSTSSKPLQTTSYSPASTPSLPRYGSGLPLPTPSASTPTPQSIGLQRTPSLNTAIPPQPQHHPQQQQQANHQPFFSGLSTRTVSQSLQHSPTSYEFPKTPQQSTSSTSNTSSSRSSLDRDSPPNIAKARTRRQSQKTKRFDSGVGNTSNPTTTNQQGGKDGPDQLEAKVVLLGSQGVGKTSIVHWYTTSQFSYSLASTIGASFLTKRLVVDGCKVRLQLWDTAGQERFRSMAPLYYRGALAAILVYDISDMDSFNDIKLWLDEFSQNMSSDLIVHVVGSKVDLAPTHRAVDLDYARRKVAEWAYEFGLGQPLEDDASGGGGGSPTRGQSPVSPSRQKSMSVSGGVGMGMGGGGGGRERIPTITTSPPTQLPTSQSFPHLSSFQQQSQPTLGERVRKMSLKLGAPAPSSVASASSASSISENEAVPSSSSGPNSGIVRSGSNFSITLGLGMSSRGRRGEEDGGAGGRGRKSKEEVERERVDELVRKCGIQVSEVSAKDAYGIEDLFLSIAMRLVERKAEIESARVLRSRDSIMLRDDHATTTATGAWCCSG